MKTKMIITAAFAALTLGTASWAMASSGDESKQSNDVKKPDQTVCSCFGSSTAELVKKAEEADKKASKADSDAEAADKHYQDVENDDKSSDAEKKKAAEDKDKADSDKKSADSDKEKADKDAKDAKKKTAKNGCVCPNGSTSYQYNVTPGSANGSAPTSAFREVRGQ